MIHRAPFGSLERLVGILIEQYAGDFPLWLAPEQARILPVTEQFVAYAHSLKQQLRAADWRVSVDASGERLGKKIRTAEKAKTPYMLVVGADEVETQTVSVRSRSGGDLGSMSAEALLAHLQEV